MWHKNSIATSAIQVFTQGSKAREDSRFIVNILQNTDATSNRSSMQKSFSSWGHRLSRQEPTYITITSL